MSLDPSTTALPRSRWLLLPVLAFLILHGALLAYDLQHPDAIFGGDRAESRWASMQDRLAASDDQANAVILKYSQPGDYVLHTWLYRLGGFPAILLMQMGVALGTLLATMSLARLLGATPQAAAVAGMLFVLLPGSIISPHLLTTETFFTACFLIGCLLLAAGMQRSSIGMLWLAVLPWAIGAFIRPQGMIFMPVAVAMIAVWHPSLRRAAFLSAALCVLLFPGLWLLWRQSLTGEVGMGESDADLGVSFRIRAHRVLNLLGITDWAAQDQVLVPRMSAQEFFSLFAQHPLGFLKTYVSDLINVALNPGANAVFGHYLKLFPTTTDPHFWKLLMDREGISGVLGGIGANGLGYVAAFFVLGAIHGLVVVSAALGIWRGLRDPATRRVNVLVFTMTLMALAVIFIAGLVRWAHRAPAEPLMAAFAGIGLVWAGGEIGRRRRQRSPPLDSFATQP